MRFGGSLLAAVAAFSPYVLAFNNPPGVDIWCGKAYRAAYVESEDDFERS